MKIEKININRLDEIVNTSNSFYKKDEILEVDNKKYKFSIYNYGIADIIDFKRFAPTSFELRGLTLNNENGEVFPSIHKFFNQGENNLVIDEPEDYLEVREKLDGSLIQPIIINDKVVYKTKGTFNSYQAKFINNKLENKNNIDKFVLDMYREYNYLPLFEIISPYNQIVVEYINTSLILIQMRDLSTGKYLEYDEMKKLANKYNIPVVAIIDVDFKTLLKWQKEKTNIEGWVIWDKNQKYTSFRKIKTEWYLTLHHLISPDNLHENRIIEHILYGTIDDVISNLSVNNPKRKDVENIIHLINKYIHNKIVEIENIYTNDKELFISNPKIFAEKYKSNEIFPIIMKIIREDNFDENLAMSLLKDFIKRQTNKLSKAKSFLSSIATN